MKRVDLIRRFRTLAQDKVQPYLWADEDVNDWLNDAQNQACIRARLIQEDANQDVCNIPLTVGVQVYNLHPAVFEISNVRLIPASGDKPRWLSIVTRDFLDMQNPDWRDSTDPTQSVIQMDKTLRVVGAFDDGDRLALECFRLPLEPMDPTDQDSAPEINPAHHEHLVHWALAKAFSIPDADTLDPKRAAAADAAFTAYFGPLPDADLRRATRADVPQYNQPDLPLI